MKKVSLLLSAMFITILSFAQISGKVVDGVTKEVLAGASITTEKGASTTSGLDGTFTLKTTKKGEDIYHEVIVDHEVKVPVNVDTNAILKDFYSKVLYKDTLHLPDSLGTVAVIDTISQNKIFGRTFNANVKQRTIKETTIVKELPKTKVFYGFEGGFNKKDVVSHIGTGIIINTKSDKIYNLGIGVANRVIDGTNGGLTPYINAGVYWKIKLRK